MLLAFRLAQSKGPPVPWVGQSASGPSRSGEVGPHPHFRVENACATDAFRNACYAVAAGIYDINLVLRVEKLKDSGLSGLVIPGAPGSDVAPPAPPPSQFAMAVTRLLPPKAISLG